MAGHPVSIPFRRMSLSVGRWRWATAIQTTTARSFHSNITPLPLIRALPSRSPRGRQNLFNERSSQQSRSFLWSSSGSSGGSSAQDALGVPDLFPQIADELLPIIMAIVLYTTQHSSEDDSSGLASAPADHQVPMEVVEVGSGRGKGCLASRDIKRGEVIISEWPLLVWPQNLDPKRAKELVDDLTPKASKVFWSLANAKPELDPPRAVRATNAFGVELPTVPPELVSTYRQAKSNAKLASFLFPKIARINHSCLPNADHAMNWSDLKMSVYATSDISSKDEICIEYTSALIQKTRDERRGVLGRIFGFACGCQACSADESWVKQSDYRRKEIDGLVRQVAEGGVSREVTLGRMERMYQLIQEEGYKAMPEFDNPNVSNAFAVFVTLRARKSNQ